MKKLLITGFAPFGGESINPSWEAVKQLPDGIGHWRLTKLELPVVFGEAFEKAVQAADACGADAVVCVGQAGGRAKVTPEMVGINLRYASIPDNAGHQPKDEPVVAGAREAYFSTVPVRKMAEAMGEKGAVSYSAGSYVCNDLLYGLLHHFHGTHVQAGFIHVPYLPQQAKEGVPCMALEEIVQALEEGIRAME